MSRASLPHPAGLGSEPIQTAPSDLAPLCRYPSATGYAQAHLHPQLFPEPSHISPSSFGPAGFPPAPALKVPLLEQYSGFPQSSQQQQHYTASALHQALLSPTPPDYSRRPQVPPILQGLLSPRHSLAGHPDLRLPQAEVAQLIKRRQQQQQQEFQELFRQMSQGDAGQGLSSMAQKLPDRPPLALPYQNTDPYHPHASPQPLLKIRGQECLSHASGPARGYAPPSALLHSESMEEEEEAADCLCEGPRDPFPGHKTKGCPETRLLLSIGGPGDSDSLFGPAKGETELGAHLYRPQTVSPFSRSEVPCPGKARLPSTRGWLEPLSRARLWAEGRSLSQLRGEGRPLCPWAVLAFRWPQLSLQEEDSVSRSMASSALRGGGGEGELDLSPGRAAGERGRGAF